MIFSENRYPLFGIMLLEIISNVLRDHRAAPIDNRRQGATCGTAGTASAAVEALHSVTQARPASQIFWAGSWPKHGNNPSFVKFSETCAGSLNETLCCREKFSQARGDTVK
jgi:hypothetical protein